MAVEHDLSVSSEEISMDIALALEEHNIEVFRPCLTWKNIRSFTLLNPHF